MSNSQKLSAMDRITSLLDANSFVEIGALVSKRSTDFNLQQKEAASDGVITGYGVINNKPVYIYSQDISALNGTLGEMHAKKITNLYNLALKTGAPIIAILDSKGLRLQEACDALNGVGEIFTSQVMASGVIPQISIIAGTCAGHSAISSSLSDFTFATEKVSKLFVNSPDAIKGNNVSKCDTSDSEYTKLTANVDFLSESEEETFAKVRQLVNILPANNAQDDLYDDCNDDLNRVVSELSSCVKDSAVILSTISDNNLFVEVKKDYAKEMVTGFIKLNGLTVGCVANRSEVLDADGNVTEKLDSVLTTKGCNKATEFINICDAFNIPILSITAVTGYAATMCQEKTIAKAVAKMTYAFANSTVPKVNLLTNNAYSSAYVAMNSKHIGADMVFAWPDAKISPMDANNAAKIIYADEISKADNAQAMINEKTALYEELMGSSLSAARRGYVDNIIEPAATRKNLIYAFEMLYTKIDCRPDKKHGTV